MSTTRQRIRYQIFRHLYAFRVGLTYACVVFFVLMAAAWYFLGDPFGLDVTQSWLRASANFHLFSDPTRDVTVTDPSGRTHALASSDVLSHAAINQIAVATLASVRSAALAAGALAALAFAYGVWTVRRETRT